MTMIIALWMILRLTRVMESLECLNKDGIQPHSWLQMYLSKGRGLISNFLNTEILSSRKVDQWKA